MTIIAVDSKLPSATVYVEEANGFVAYSTLDLFQNRNVVIVTIPGAYTFTCSEKHLPGFRLLADSIIEKGVDKIYILSSNDPFVLSHWLKDMELDPQYFAFLADANLDLIEKMGLKVDFTDKGLGFRSLRGCFYVENLVVKYSGVDINAGLLEYSTAESLMDYLNTELAK